MREWNRITWELEIGLWAVEHNHMGIRNRDGGAEKFYLDFCQNMKYKQHISSHFGWCSSLFKFSSYALFSHKKSWGNFFVTGAYYFLKKTLNSRIRQTLDFPLYQRSPQLLAGTAAWFLMAVTKKVTMPLFIQYSVHERNLPNWWTVPLWYVISFTIACQLLWGQLKLHTIIVLRTEKKSFDNFFLSQETRVDPRMSLRPSIWCMFDKHRAKRCQ